MNILLTNVRVGGHDLSEDGITDVMILDTKLTADVVSAAYCKEGTVTFDECYEVPDEDVKFYVYEPCWLNEAEEARALEMAA